MKNKTLKIVISLIVGIIGAILFANSVYAESGFNVYSGDYTITNGHFAPQNINGHGLLYCIQGRCCIQGTHESR